MTDSRVVFFARARGRGTQRPSMFVQQTKLENITGIAAYVSRRISLTLLVFTLFGALITVASIAAGQILLFLVFGVLTLAALFALIGGSARRGSTGVIIHAGATEHSPINFGQFGEQRSRMGNFLHALLRPLLSLFGVFTAFDVLIAPPGEDAELIVAELGALIFDLQSRGNLAGEHWGVQTAGSGQQRGQGI